MREQPIPNSVPYVPQTDSDEFPYLFLPKSGMVPYGGPPENEDGGDFKWAIVGGGIHGTYLANALIHGGLIPPSRIAVFDPHDSLLAFWKRATGNTGMTHLRSGSVHHIDYFPVSLRQFYGSRRETYGVPFVPKYNRPSLKLFNDHCDWVIKREGLEGLHIRERITGLTRRDGLWHLSSGKPEDKPGRTWTSANVILAIGLGEQPRYPDWARMLIDAGDRRVAHLFADGYDIGEPAAAGTRTVILGAGISALQSALFLKKRYPGDPVTIVADHPIARFDFDSDPGFIGPRRLELFSEEKDPAVRRKRINDVRFPGTGDPGLVERIEGAIGTGAIGFVHASVGSVESKASELIFGLSPADGGTPFSISADRVILATGFSPERPGGAMVDELISQYSLPTGSCGYPIPDMSLRWSAGLYVTGPLGELEIGPVARNIVGAKRAGERIVASLHGVFGSQAGA